MDFMATLWADHLDMARCCELIAEEDLGAAVVALGGSIALLQRDLLMLVWTEELVSGGVSAKRFGASRVLH